MQVFEKLRFYFKRGRGGALVGPYALSNLPFNSVLPLPYRIGYYILSNTLEGKGIIRLYYQRNSLIVKAMEEDEA